MLKTLEVPAGTDIVKQGDRGTALYIIRAGSVEIIRNGGIVKTMGKWGYFGERSLILAEPRGATVRASSAVSLYVLEQDDLNRVVDERMRINVIQSVQMEQLSLCLEDFYVVSRMEANQCSETFLLQHNKTNLMFIAVVYGKGKLAGEGKMGGMREKVKLYRELDHPLIAKTYNVVRTESHLYLIKEFILGTTLDRLIFDHGKLNESIVRFYLGNLILTLEYLHDRSMLYRNFASEYIIIDKQGYPRLIIFEYTKRVEGRTNSVAGIPYFMAPEVVLGQYYGIGADMWSLGVLLFEMTQGKVPFGAAAQTPYEVYEDILKHKKVKAQGSPTLAVLIDTLLTANPATRAKGGLDALKRTEWFQGFPWEEVMTQEAIPPFIPRPRRLPKEFDTILARKELITSYCPPSTESLPRDQEALWNAIEV